MRGSESQYWDGVCLALGGKGDNIWKRCAIASRVLKHRPVHARILEIGVGQGLTAAVVNLATLGEMKYTGTDVSPEFCAMVSKQWKLSVVNTDILALPSADGGFDMVWAFDTLEHVRPEDRAAGYREIDRVLAPQGIILLNLPLNESQHESEFDWGIQDHDVTHLAAAIGGRVTVWDAYHIEEVDRSYAWVEITR